MMPVSIGTSTWICRLDQAAECNLGIATDPISVTYVIERDRIGWLWRGISATILTVMQSLSMLPVDVRMSELLPWCRLHRKADRVLFIARTDSARKRRVLIEPEVDQSIQRELGASILRIAWVEAWPVVQLVKHAAKAYVLQLDDRLIRKMVRTQDRFFGWNVSNQPALPEDCCIYRAGDSLPIVMSRTHTRDAWLLTDKGPHFRGAVEAPWDDELLAYVPRTKDFIQEVIHSDH